MSIWKQRLYAERIKALQEKITVPGEDFHGRELDVDDLITYLLELENRISQLEHKQQFDSAGQY